MQIPFGYEPGYSGAFTRAQADGAWPNGTRVRKIKTEPGDFHAVGARATILGSVREPDGERRIMYFVEWDSTPRVAVSTMGWKLDRITEQ